jgi:hypothetical protein
MRSASLFFFLLFFSTLSFSQNIQNVKLSDIKKAFAEKSLTKYIQSGQSVMAFFDRVFENVSNPSVLDSGFAAEYFDLEYQANLRPNTPEPFLTLTELTADTNNLIRLHKKFYSKIKNKVFLRNYFQLAFIGLLHTIESIKRVQVGLSQDGYDVLANLILEHGRLITSDQKSLVTMTDFWWDYMWAYFLNYPVDIIELGNQKLRGVWLNENRDFYKKRIEKFLASYSMLGLRKATSPIIYRDITNQLFVRLAKNAYEIYSLREDPKALSKARIFKYKFETKTGLTEDAEKTKREIAREGLVTRFRKLFSDPFERLMGRDGNIASRFFGSITTLFYSLYSLVRYLVGFLLITFPFDGAFVLAGLIILSIEGRIEFKNEFWPIQTKTVSRTKWLRYTQYLVFKFKRLFARIVNDLAFSVQMLTYSYTNDSSTRNVRIGSSLLIFGLGLFFSSARSMVETFVAQMAL